MEEKILENELVRKRKSTHDDDDDDDDDTTSNMVENPRKLHPHPLKKPMLGLNIDLNLSLSSSSSTNPTPPLPPPPPPSPLVEPSQASGSGRRGRRNSRSEGRGSRPPLKTDRITSPYPWATDRRAKLHSMEYLVSQGITTITGDVQCKKCERNFKMEYDLGQKFQSLVMFIIGEEGIPGMKDRAPKGWMKPMLPTCKFCGEENSCKPMIEAKKRCINWLFLLLGQLLGCCTLEQLKYFCKHNHSHRTGAKDRVLFLSYFTLCKQLDPNGPFHF